MTAPSLLHLAVLGLAAGGHGPTRRLVFQHVAKHPGLHQREIARALDLRPAAAEHHLRHLERAGLLQRQEDGGFVRYYATVQEKGPVPVAAVAAEDKRRLAVLRQARPLQAVAHLLQAPDGMTLGDLADRMDISPGTLTYQVKKLESVGLVRRWRDGRRRLVALVDRDDAVRILLEYQPPADLVAGFEDLWDDVGF